MLKTYYGLTNPQKSIWLTNKMYENTSINNICGTFYIEEEINFNALEKSINILIEKNDSFRIKLTQVNGEIKQYIDEFSPSKIEYIEINDSNNISILEKSLVSEPFNMFDSFLYVFKLFKLPNGHGGIFMKLHHIISDAWASSLIINQIMKNYELIKKNEYVDTEYPSYLEYISSEQEYLGSEKFLKDKLFWEEYLKILPESGTIPNTSVQTCAENSYTSCRKQMVIPKSLIKSINNLCKENRVSIFNFFLGVYSIYISKTSNLADFIIGTPVLNRCNFREKNTAGIFISTVPFRASINDESFLDLIANMSKDFLSIFRHQKYPYQLLLEDLRKADPSVSNLYDILISYQNTRADNQISETVYYSTWTPNNCAANGLSIHLFDTVDTGNLFVAYDYLVNKFSENEIEAIHKRILYIIEQVLEDHSVSASKLEIVTPEEKKQLLSDFNNTYFEYDRKKTAVDLVEEAANKFSDNTAIVFENESLTYRELNEKANSLANYLITNGTNPGDIIGIMVNRSLEMIIRNTCNNKNWK